MAELSSVLIVDDEKDNLEALKRLLRNQFEVTTTVSPLDALKLVQQTTYHVIVSDQRMPEISGVELLEKIKVLSPSSIRILLTGYTDIDSVIGAINRGNIYRYIAKPWDPEEFKLTLRQADEAFRLRRELEIKNEELTRSNRQLQTALEALRQLDRAKARFMSLVSHELNTPLTVILSFVGVLADHKGTLGPELNKTVGALESASARFSEIVSEVLTYVRLESDPELHYREVAVRDEIAAVRASLAEGLKKKNLTLRVNSPDAKLACDPDKFRVAARKVLENAIVDSPENGTLTCTVSESPDFLRLELERGGVALSRTALEPFEPAGQTMHHQRDLGLSLAICKLIVESHGGEVSAEAHDEVSKVKLTFPRAR